MVETDDIAQFKGLILAQQEEITALKAVIADLMARLAQNSANFHKPPSSDGLTKKPLLTAALQNKPVKNQVDNPDILATHFTLSCNRTVSMCTSQFSASVVAYPSKQKVISWHLKWGSCACLNCRVYFDNTKERAKRGGSISQCSQK